MGEHPHPQQAGPKIPSWMNERKKVAISSLSCLWLHMYEMSYIHTFKHNTVQKKITIDKSVFKKNLMQSKEQAWKG